MGCRLRHACAQLLSVTKTRREAASGRPPRPSYLILARSRHIHSDENRDATPVSNTLDRGCSARAVR